MVDIAAVADPLAVAAQTVTNVSLHTVYADNATVGTAYELMTNLNADITQLGTAGDGIEVVGGDWPSFFKCKEDWQWVKNNEWNEIEFLLNVKGDYGKEEIETICNWKRS